MTALLAAEVETGAEHFIDHVLVAHARARDLPARLFDHRVQTGIAHDGGDERFLSQRTFGEHLQTANRHDIVAVNQLAGLVAE